MVATLVGSGVNGLISLSVLTVVVVELGFGLELLEERVVRLGLEVTVGAFSTTGGKVVGVGCNC